MQFYVPEIGEMIVLTTDWPFTLYREYRNSKLIEKLDEPLPKHNLFGKDYPQSDYTPDIIVAGPSGGGRRTLKSQPCLLEKGTTLRVDRIYVRKGNSDYSSLTFIIKNGPYRGARFWAKLDDVNTLTFEKTREVTEPVKGKKPSRIDNVLGNGDE